MLVAETTNIKHNPSTPEALCRHIVSMFEWEDFETVLEPARGTGNFWRAIPSNVCRDWCEIQEGRDFFQYDKRCDTIITNPPFREEINGVRVNMVTRFLEHSMEIADKRIIFLMKMFVSLTPLRLSRYQANGWNMTRLKVFNIRAWFGRFSLVVFEKNKPSIIEWSTQSW